MRVYQFRHVGNLSQLALYLHFAKLNSYDKLITF